MEPGTDTIWGRRDWWRVTLALTVLIVVTTVALPGPALVLGLVGMFYLLNRQLTMQEALLGTFLFATALASSRLGPHQFMKPMRLPLLGLLALVGLARFRSWPVEARRAHLRWLLLLLLITLLPTVINSGWHRLDVQVILLPGGWFVYGLLMFHLTEAERTERFRMLAVLLPAVFLSLFVFGWIAPGGAQLVGRFRGWFGNPNEVSHWWLAACAVLVAIALRLKRRDLLFLVGLATVLLYLRSGSRTPLGGALLIFVGSWFLSRQTPRWLRGFALFVSAFLLLVLPTLSVEQLGTVLPESLLRTETLEEGGGRFVAWRFGWEQLQERFWWGGGAGFEEFIYGQYSQYLSMLNHQGLSHNSYLALALNFGVLGAAGLALTLWKKLGLLQLESVFIVTLPFFATTVFEGVLTSPLNSATPMWFLAASLVSQEIKQ